jgi:hypothetical protein
VSADQQQLMEARRVIYMLVRACRQTQTFFEGVSVLDKMRVQRLLRDAVRQSDQFLGAA